MPGEYKGLEIRAADGLHQDCFEMLRRVLPEGARVVDLAAGAGAFSQRLADTGYEVIANDIDDAPWRADGVPKIRLDLNENIDDDLPLHSFGAVIAMEVIEHLNSPKKLLDDCCRLVAPGGVVLLSTPNVMDLESRLIFFRSGFFYHFSPASYHATGHKAILPHWLLELLLAEAGLEILERRFSGHLPKASSRSGWRAALMHVARKTLRLLVKPSEHGVLDSNYVIYLLRVRETAAPVATA